MRIGRSETQLRMKGNFRAAGTFGDHSQQDRLVVRMNEFRQRAADHAIHIEGEGPMFTRRAGKHPRIPANDDQAVLELVVTPLVLRRFARRFRLIRREKERFRWQVNYPSNRIAETISATP